jgi:hypothetical protein
VHDLVGPHAELAHDDREQALGLPLAVVARREDAVEPRLVEEPRLHERAQLRAAEVGVRHRRDLLAGGPRRAYQVDHVQVGHQQVALDLHLDLSRIERRGPAQHDRRQLLVDLLERHLHPATARLERPACVPLGLLAEPPEAERRDVLGEEATREQPLGDQREGVDRVHHPAEEERVEDVEREQLHARPGDELERSLEARVGRAHLALVDGRHRAAGP